MTSEITVHFNFFSHKNNLTLTKSVQSHCNLFIHVLEPTAIGQEAGHSLDRSPVNHRADTVRQTPFTLIHTDAQIRIANLKYMFLDVGGKLCTLRKPTQIREEHANSAEKGPSQ